MSDAPSRRELLLKTWLPPAGIPAVSAHKHLRIETETLRGRRAFCLFNWRDQPITLSGRLSRRSRVTDAWTGASPGEMQNVRITNMPAPSARLLECMDA